MAGLIGGRSEQLVTTYVLDADKYVKELGEVTKAIRKEEKADKDLVKIKKKLGIETTKQEKRTKRLAMASQAMATAAGQVLAGAFTRLTRAIGNAVQQARDYEDWIGTNTGSLSKLRTETQGLIGDLELARAQTRLTTGDFQLNEKQIAAVTKAAISLTRTLKVPFSNALDQITRDIKKGSTRALKELGINVDLVGNAAQKTETAIRLVTERFGEMEVQAENTNERVDQLKNSINAVTGAFGSFVLRTVAGKPGIDGMTRSLNDMADALNKITPARRRQIAITGRLAEISRAIQAKEAGQELGPLQLRTGQISAFETGQKGLGALRAEQARLNAELSANRVKQELDANLKIGKDMNKVLVNIAQQTAAVRAGGVAPRTGARGGPGGLTLGTLPPEFQVTRDPQFEVQRIVGDQVFDPKSFEGLDIQGTLTGPMTQANAAAERLSQTIAGFAGMNMLQQILPSEEFDRVMNQLASLDEGTRNLVGSLMEGMAGLGAAFSDAIFMAISGEESFGNAIKSTFSQWLKTWGNKMMLQSLEYAALALGKAAMWDWAGAGKAAAASAAFGVAAVAAGLGARALAPSKKSSTASRRRGVDRGLGGAGTSGAAAQQQVTLVYNVNTLLPPREDEAATQVAGLVARAKGMGLAA
jgi:hypothetical protein